MISERVQAMLAASLLWLLSPALGYLEDTEVKAVLHGDGFSRTVLSSVYPKPLFWRTPVECGIYWKERAVS